MTFYDFYKLDFKCCSNLSLKDEHVMTLRAVYNGHVFCICSHTPWDNELMQPKKGARCYAHYEIDGKVYKSTDKLKEALSKLSQ